MRRALLILVVAMIGALGSSDQSLAGSGEEWKECPNLEDLDRAISACTRIIKRRGEGRENTGKAYNNRCAAYSLRQKYEQAIADCSKAIQFVQDYVTAYSNRCRAASCLTSVRLAAGAS